MLTRATDRKRNIALYTAGILLCLTLWSLYLVSGLYAKYTTSGSVGDQAHASAFYLKADGDLFQSVQLEMIPGEKVVKELDIVNKSEVKMKYTLIIQNETGNLPLQYTLENKDTSAVYEPLLGKYTIEGELEPGEKTDHYSLTIFWPEGTESPDPNLQYIGMLDYMTINVNAVQCD